MKNHLRRRSPYLECLEDRWLPSTFSEFPPIDPIDPSFFDEVKLWIAQKHADAGRIRALDNTSIPFVVASQSGEGEVSLRNWKSGIGLSLDVDDSWKTGFFRKDLYIKVNTERPTGDSEDWHLRLRVKRLGWEPFAEDVSLAIAFPFDAFNGESLSGPPNILMGFEIAAGVAPKYLDMRFYPHQLAGSNHDFEWDIHTHGADNPVKFFAGHFDGDDDSGYQNATLLSADVTDVPHHIHVDMSVAESQLGAGPADSVFDVQWTASSETPVTFVYAEAETAEAAAGFDTADFFTRWTTDVMPTSEHLTLHHDENAGQLTLQHNANAPIGQMKIEKTRSDGLTISAEASEVPTEVDLNLNLDGGLDLDVNDHTLDLNLQASQTGGFQNTDGFLGHNLGYLSAQLEDAPDLTSNFDAQDKSFHAEAVNPGDYIPFLELILDDNGEINSENMPVGLDLPPSYGTTDDEPRLHHLFSLVDDGTHGTAVARALDAAMATFDHDSGPVEESFELETLAPAPMQFYLRTGVDSILLPALESATGPDPYAEITCNIDDVPAGHSLIKLNPPFGFSVDTEEPVESISCFGHIGTFHAGLALEDIPANGSFDFRPEGSLDVTAADSAGNPDAFGSIAVHLFDENGFDPNVVALPASGKTFFPEGTRLKDAKLRLDGVPTLSATWDNQPNSTSIDIDTALDANADPTNPLAYVEGLQLSVATMLPAEPQIDLLHFLPADETSSHFARLIDQPGEQVLEGGIFGIDQFHFATDDTGLEPSSFEIDWKLRPDRPFTPFSLNIDATPSSLGALGAFFGNDHVTGSLDLSYVPSQLNLASNLDPEICTNGLFGVELPPELVPPIPSTIDLDLSYDDTLLLVHAEDLPPVFCLTWDTSNPTGVIQVVAEELNGDPARAGLVEVLFQNDLGLPGDAAIFEDPDNPLLELRIRIDDAPSFEGTWQMNSNDPNFVLGTVADAPSPFSILGGLRLTTRTETGSQDLPVFPALTGQEDHFFEFLDQGKDKNLGIGIFGVDEVSVLMRNNISTVNFEYLGNAGRTMQVHIASENGIFFPDKTVDVAILVEDLPQTAEMVFTTTGEAFSLQASDGIDRIRVGGPALLGLEGDEEAKFDNVRSLLELNTLPSQVNFANIANESIRFEVGGTSETIGFVQSHVSYVQEEEEEEEEEGGLDTEDPLFGDPLRDVRVRFDEIPSLNGVYGTKLIVPKTTELEASPDQGDVVVNTAPGKFSSAVLLEDANRNLPLRLIHARNGGFSPGDTLVTADRLMFQSQRRQFLIGQVIQGYNSGAQGKVARIDRVADHGTLYLIDVTGSFQGEEPLVLGNALYAFADGELEESSDWSALVDEGVTEAGMMLELKVEDPDQSLAGAQIAASTRVGLAPLPVPSPALNHYVTIEDLRIGEAAPAAGRLEFGIFDFNSVELSMAEEITAAFETLSPRPLNVDFRRDFGSAFPLGEEDQAIDLDLDINSVPANLMLTADFTGVFQYQASEAIDSIDLEVMLDHVDEGAIRNLTVVEGLVDLNKDGLVTANDDGFYDDVRVINGAFDIDDDEDIDSDDDGEIDGVMVIDGALDLDGNGAIEEVDSSQQNGTKASFSLIDLPEEIDLRVHPGVMPVIGGLLDLNVDGEIDADDSGRFAGFPVLEGAIDEDANGLIDGADFIPDLFGQRILDGKVDLNGDNVLDAADTGDFGGLVLSMSAGIESVQFEAMTLGDTASLFGSEMGNLRRVDINAMQIPAQWNFSYSLLEVDTGEEKPATETDLVFSITDAAGQAQPFGRIQALVSNTTDPIQFARQMAAFSQQDPGSSGSTPQRVNYSPFAEEIDERYYEEGDADGVLDKLDEIYAQGSTFDASEDYIVMRQAAGVLELLNANFGGLQSATVELDVPAPGTELGPVPLDSVKATLRAPSPGIHPLYFGMGQSTAEINELDDGTYRGVAVINGALDLNNDGAISEEDTDGIVGFSVIEGRLDLNSDGEIGEDDDGYLEGLRVIDGWLDVSESLTTLKIDNVPDEIVAELMLDPGRLRYNAEDDADASTGRVDLYQGPMPFADDNDVATRVIIDDVPESVEIRWEAAPIPMSLSEVTLPFLEINSSGETEVLGVLQMPTSEGGPVERMVFGMQVEDLQLGYDLDVFNFDVAETFEVKFGIAIIDGKLDMDDNGIINNQDDGFFGGGVGVIPTPVINGFLDVDGDGNVNVDTSDDGIVGGFTVIDGRIDVDEDGDVDGSDDFDNTLIELPTAWDLLRATAGIDNDVDNLEIEANFNKAAVNGFFSYYQPVSDPEALNPGGPAPRSVEYTPLVSLVLDDFRELSASAAVTLDPFTPNLGPLPFSLVADVTLEGSIVFDYWSPFDVQESFTIDFPDVTGLPDLTVGVENQPDYIDNTPIHLFPVTGLFVEPTFQNSVIFFFYGLHDFSDHEDPFD